MTIQEALAAHKQIFIVCDRNVEGFARFLGDYPLLAIDTSEEQKTMDGVLGICRWLLKQGADRGALVLAAGGGITTDMVGFAASIYKRGIDYANIPTTLLAQVDAAIGGKTGVNLDSYKNLLGSFRQPEFTYIFPDVLRSLPRREFLSGAAEMLKTFIINNINGNYEKAVRLIGEYARGGANPACTAEGLTELSALIQDASNVKQGIVDKDPLEKGERRKLNLGHTWGHAIEWWQQTHDSGGKLLSHGEAVAIGIVQAARRSEELGLAEKGLAAKLKADFESCGLPTELPCPESELLQAMKIDKKAEGGKVRFVLPVKIGKVVVKSLSIIVNLQSK